MNKNLKRKISESFSSVLPITVIVLLLSMLVVPVSIDAIIMFLMGAVLLVVGMGFFTLGADVAMMPMGEGVGKELGKSKIWTAVITVFVMGIVVTLAEPDLAVLAKQVPAIPDFVLTFTVAVGVGLLFAAAVFRIWSKVSLTKILIASYGLVFLVAFLAPQSFISVAFDSGGVTTGPITVPFIMSLGLGYATVVRKGKDSQEDSFGLVALCSVGPILAVLLLGILFNPQDAAYSAVELPAVDTFQDAFLQFTHALPEYTVEVLSAILPIVVILILFQLVRRTYSKKQMMKMGVGFVYTFIGLVLFLTGVNVGFIPVGYIIGSQLAGSAYSWILIPIGMLIGYFIVSAEPAVHVLNKQVSEVSGGSIPEKTMMLFLSVGMSVSLGLSMVRVLTGLNIFWFLIPGYGIAILLTKFVPKIFTGIAFDSGGVCSGPMTSTFLLPFAMGACEAAGGNIMTDAFGIVAMVAMTPLITVQIMGLLYGRKLKKLQESEDVEIDEEELEELEDMEVSQPGLSQSETLQPELPQTILEEVAEHA